MPGIYIMPDGVTGCAWLRVNWATRCPVWRSAISCKWIVWLYLTACHSCILWGCSYLHTVHIIFLCNSVVYNQYSFNSMLWL